ncbi:MAG: hypothetical protein RL380_72, partial [Verrucomicrobiota bacterium]
ASFALTASTNGSATLLPDGYTARFTATNNFSGLAQFAFTASNTVDAASLGSVAVAVLVITNTSPTLAVITNRTLIAGATLAFTSSANDTNIPSQTLTFSGQNFPANASVNASNGQFSWRPLLAQSPTTNNLKLIVTDNGSPNLSATQAFTVTVNSPAAPNQAVTLSNSQLQFLITGDAGPDYTVQASSNLTSWLSLFTTNSPPLPFTWQVSPTNLSQQFFRLQLGP